VEAWFSLAVSFGLGTAVVLSELKMIVLPKF
jgi:hypothetical protein